MNLGKQKVAYSVLGHAPNQKSDETSERGLFSWIRASSLVSQCLLVNHVDCLRTHIICSYQNHSFFNVLGHALN